MNKLRVVFAGTPDFAATALATILESAIVDIVGVYTQPDRPAGRGLKLAPSAVKLLAKKKGLPVYQPTSLKTPDAQITLAQLHPDIMVVAAYGLILPKDILGTPRLGCINIHASLLPRWRGAAPIQRALLAGDAETGICIMQMDVGLDTGDILSTDRLAILANDTTGTLHDRLATLGGTAIVATLRQISNGHIVATPQIATGASYAHKIEKAEAGVNWADDAQQLDRQIRAFNPFPGAVTQWRGEPLKLWCAKPDTTLSGPVGYVMVIEHQGIAIACGQGGLWLTEVQRAGGRRMPASAWAQKGLRLGEFLGNSAAHVA